MQPVKIPLTLSLSAFAAFILRSLRTIKRFSVLIKRHNVRWRSCRLGLQCICLTLMSINFDFNLRLHLITTIATRVALSNKAWCVQQIKVQNRRATEAKRMCYVGPVAGTNPCSPTDSHSIVKLMTV